MSYSIGTVHDRGGNLFSKELHEMVVILFKIHVFEHAAVVRVCAACREAGLFGEASGDGL